MIYVKYKMDLEDVFSICAARRFIIGDESKLKLVSENWDGSEASDSDVIIGINANGKGIIGYYEDDCYISSTTEIINKFAKPEEKIALIDLALFIDFRKNQNLNDYMKTVLDGCEDNEGMESLKRIDLAAVFEAARAILERPDEVIAFMEVIFEGLLKKGLEKIELVQSKKTGAGLSELYRDLQEAGVIPKMSPVTLPKKDKS